MGPAPTRSQPRGDRSLPGDYDGLSVLAVERAALASLDDSTAIDRPASWFTANVAAKPQAAAYGGDAVVLLFRGVSVVP